MAASIEHYALPAPVFDRPTRLLVVCAPYYKDIADQLQLGAMAAIAAAGATGELVHVPGALEIPPAIALAAANYDGFVALGCIVRGETTHYDTVCNDSSRGLMLLGLQGHCIGNAILTVETLDQATVRAEAGGQNKGGGAAIAAMHLIALKRRFAAGKSA
jgi:6,7-dimethyl-8-ribityllumazine synthase